MRIPSPIDINFLTFLAEVGIDIVSYFFNFIDFLKLRINSLIFNIGTPANISSNTLVKHSLNAAGKLERTISKPLT